MIKAVLFDLGNTLIEYPTPEELRTNYRNNAGHMAGAIYEPLLDKMQEILSRERKFGMETHDEATIEIALMNAGRIQNFPLNKQLALQMIGDLYYYGFGKFTSPVPGALKLLQFLKNHRMKLGIVSNTPFPGSFFKMEMERYMMAGFFQSFVWSSEFGKRKPSPDIFHKALEELRVSPDEAVFVGDKIDRDVMGARGVGMKAIWFDRKGKPDDRTLISPNGPNTYRVLSLNEIMDLDLFK